MKNTYKTLLATTAAAATVLMLTGCAGGTVPTASSSATTPQGPGAAPSSSNTDSGGTSSANTPGAVLAAWVTDVVDGDYLAACSKMAVSSDGTATGTPVPGTPARCTKTTTTGAITTSPESIIKDLHPSFTPKSLSGHASVTVGQVPATDSSITVDAKQVSINGTPLNEVIAANSTGITAGQVELTFSLGRLNGTWYVENFNLNV